MNYAPEVAGVGRYTGEIGAHMASLGHEVFVVTTPAHYPGWAPQGGPRSNRWSKETLDGAVVYRCPLYLHSQMRGIWRLLAPLSFALSSAPVAFWQILRLRPDVVIAVEPTLLVGPVTLFAAKLVGAKAVLHVQDLEVDAAFAMGHLRGGGMLSRLASSFDRVVTRGFDRVITISNRMKAKLAQKGVKPEQITVVRNWVDLAQIQPLTRPSAYRAELGLAEGTFVVLYSGSIGAKQGVGMLIDAARTLISDPSVLLVIAGQGPMRGALERAAVSLSNIRVLDFQPEERFSEFLGLADLHVLPQEAQAADLMLPSKLGGMLASGRPILVTADANTELAEFLGGSCSYTPPGDAQAFAASILRLRHESSARHQEAERLALAEQLSKSVVINAFVDSALFIPAPPAVSSDNFHIAA